MYRWWPGDGGGSGKEIDLAAPFFVFGAAGGVGAGRVVASPTPVPFAVIAEEYIHPQSFFYPEDESVFPGRSTRIHNLNSTSNIANRVVLDNIAQLIAPVYCLLKNLFLLDRFTMWYHNATTHKPKCYARRNALD